MYICELKKYVKNEISKFLVQEIKRSSRTRSEKNECKESIIAWLKNMLIAYGWAFSKRLKFADQHGITRWSEALAEGIFFLF